MPSESTPDTSTPVASAPVTSNPSRKRSREEDPDDPTLARAPPPERIYGESMPLIDSSNERATSAESRAGTWYEPRLEEEGPAAAASATKPFQGENVVPRRTKCLRRDAILNAVRAGQPSNHPSGLMPNRNTDGPSDDAVARLLGVGWMAPPMDEATQAAVRGWAKYIENNHPLTNVQIISQKGNENYLIKAEQGFFLFDEDLNGARSLEYTWDDCHTASDWDKCETLGDSSDSSDSSMSLEGVEATTVVESSSPSDAPAAGQAENPHNPNTIAQPPSRVVENAAPESMDVD